MIKIIITGSNGLLGQSLLALLLGRKDKYEVVGFSRGINKSGRHDFQYVSIDLTNESRLFEELERVKPDVIVNTAAMKQVDQCEKEKYLCEEINVQLVDNLIQFSEKNNVYIVHLSTDFIFDGDKGFYKENDIPSPLNYYGVSKWKAEKKLIESNVNYAILRTILVYGIDVRVSCSNIVLWVKESLESGVKINVVDDQYRMPTFVDSLAEVCQAVIKKRKKGIFNVSSKKLLSVYDIAMEIAEVFNLNKELIFPISTEKLSQLARRPKITRFDLSKTEKEFQLNFKEFSDDLKRFKQKIT